MGLTIPGCAETFSSKEQQQQQEQGQGQGQEQEQGGEQSQQPPPPDQHQRVIRIGQGDAIAVPSGAAHWCANHDAEENLVVIIVKDLNHLSNQLDERLRVLTKITKKTHICLEQLKLN